MASLRRHFLPLAYSHTIGRGQCKTQPSICGSGTLMRILGKKKIPLTASVSLPCSAIFPAWLPSLPHQGPCPSSSISHRPNKSSTRDGTHLHTTAHAVSASPRARCWPIFPLQGAFLSSSGYTGLQVSPFRGLSPASSRWGGHLVSLFPEHGRLS